MKSNIMRLKFILLEVCTFLVIATMLVFSISEGSEFRETINYLRLENLVMYSLIAAIFWELLYFIYAMYLSMSASYKLSKSRSKVKTQSYEKALNKEPKNEGEEVQGSKISQLGGSKKRKIYGSMTFSRKSTI